MKKFKYNNPYNTYSQAYTVVRRLRKEEREKQEKHEMHNMPYERTREEFKVEKEDGKYQVYCIEQ